MEIHNLLEKGPAEFESSRSFMLGGMEMSVVVITLDQEVLVGLDNYNQEDVVTSVTFKEASGWEHSWEMGKIERKTIKWASKSLSFKEYKKYAMEKEDVFKLEVTVTLHTRKCVSSGGSER